MATRECVNKCGWTAFGSFSTCCTRCPNHALDCSSKNTRIVVAPAPAVAASTSPAYSASAKGPQKRPAPSDNQAGSDWDPIKQRFVKKAATDSSNVTSGVPTPPSPSVTSTAPGPAAASRATPKGGKKKLRLAATPQQQAGLGKNAEMIACFDEMALIYQKINDQMRKNSYTKISAAIRSQSKAITSGKEAKKLDGIGKAGSEKIDEYLATGKIKKLLELRETHRDLLQLTSVHGVGPKMAEKLIAEGITSLDLLKDAILVKKRSFPGWASASTACLKHVEDLQKRIPRAEIDEIAATMTRLAQKVDTQLSVTVCGSYRRGASTSGDIDVLLVHPSGKNCLHPLVDAMKSEGLLIDVLSMAAPGAKHGKMMGVCRLSDGPARRIDLQSTDPTEYGCALLYFTGSGAFARALREEAKAQGYTLNEHQLKETGGLKRVIPTLTEKDVFEALGLEYVAPTAREYGK